MSDNDKDCIGLRVFFSLGELAALLFHDDFEYALDEQEYVIATHTGFTEKEITMMTRPRRIKMFERIVKDMENENDWRRVLLETIAHCNGLG